MRSCVHLNDRLMFSRLAIDPEVRSWAFLILGRWKSGKIDFGKQEGMHILVGCVQGPGLSKRG